MRTYTDGATMTIDYPDNFTFSGDLNRFAITKNTTATNIEISYTISGYTYVENFFFLTATIEFSMADTFRLLYSRTANTMFVTSRTFSFTIKLYNNTTLLDTVSLSIGEVILGKRRVYDKKGILNNFTFFDVDLGLSLNTIGYYFTYDSAVNAVLVDASVEYIDNYTGLSNVPLTGLSNDIDYLYYIVSNFMLNPTFNYLGGVNYWNNIIDFPGCSSTFEIDITNKLKFIIPDVSCGDTMEIQYTGGTFTPSVNYTIDIYIDSITNPSGNDIFLTISLGGTNVTFAPSVGNNSISMVCGLTRVLKLIGFMDANTSGYGTHSFSITNIIVKDLVQHPIYLNQDCEGNGTKLGLRFLNRFGIWRNYYVIKKVENIVSSNGTSLWFLDNNYTEFNNLNAEQNKGYSQSLNVYRDGVEKEVANDFSDIIYTDHVQLYDHINSVWIPVKVNTNTFSIVDKDNLFDISLTLLLQNNG